MRQKPAGPRDGMVRDARENVLEPGEGIDSHALATDHKIAHHRRGLAAFIAADENPAEIRKLHHAGVSKSEIARRSKVGRASARRVLVTYSSLENRSQPPLCAGLPKAHDIAMTHRIGACHCSFMRSYPLKIGRARSRHVRGHPTIEMCGQNPAKFPAVWF
jgi:hypothetical protein